MCPSAAETGYGNFIAYGMNMRLSTWESPTPDRLDGVAPPFRQVFLADGPGSHCSILPSAQAYSPSPRHQRALNVAFLDGHAATYPGASVGCGIGDPLRSDVMWTVPGSAWPGPP